MSGTISLAWVRPFELVTGRAAFAGQVRADVFHAIENDEPPAPRKLNPQCPYDWETIILKAISKDREERYPSAAAMRDDLGRVLRGEPIYGRRPACGNVDCGGLGGIARW